MKRISILHISILIAFGASATIPNGYYSSCEGKSGKLLLESLEKVVGPHTTVSYDGLWEVYYESDLDADGKLWDIYSTKRWTYPGSKCGSYSQEGDCYNREHSFPKSWFSNQSPMVSDAFHIYPTDGKVNGMRSNYPYGETKGETWKASGVGLGKLGSCTFSGYSGKVFEPDDEYKGDLARTYFYMIAAYNDRVSNWNSDMLDGNSFPAFSSWAINLLLKWHRQDPVSPKETARNEAIYGFQHNRNPFIDHPELAEHIWGNASSTAWYVGGDASATLALPVDGSTLDFGTVALNYQTSRYLQIKGSNFTAPLSLSIDNSAFQLSASSFTAAGVNNGTGVSISFTGHSVGRASGTLTLTSGGSAVARVTLTANIINGIPLNISNIGETSFRVNWTDLSDDDFYTLDVTRNGESIEGYPCSVLAALEEYDVTGLQPGVEYAVRIQSESMTSETVKVTTEIPTPSIQYTEDPEYHINTLPGTPSNPIELWIEVENIDGNFTATVTEPFELSTDCNNWSRSITLDPQEDRFFIRINTLQAGEYETFITLAYDTYINDEAHVTASVRSESKPWFIEDFENADKQGFTTTSYDMGSFKGKSVEWTVNNAGIWSSDKDKNGNYSLRLGKTTASNIATTRPKESGIGTVSFEACRWSAADGDVTLDVQISPDGAEWQTMGTVVISSETLSHYEVVVNKVGNYYLRLQQTAGARGNIDDIVVSDHLTDAVNEIDDIALSTWTAYNLDNNLVIENYGSERRFLIYDLRGIILYDESVIGSRTFTVAPGLYLVSDRETLRRVIIK